MCGICGQVNCDRSQPVDAQVLQRMSAVIRHRGPDSYGQYLCGNVGMAVRRLAIIDLSTGDQPISNERGTVWIALNGEIYNYRELRTQLQAEGHVFRTTSDTEVIVHLYEERGPGCVRALRGMFAFAIWDAERRRMVLARDRLGQKPLYYTEMDGGLLFGSELKSILQFPDLRRQVDPVAIHHYLTLQAVPDPWTPLKGIRKLPPAHVLVWSEGHSRMERYWEPVYEPKWELPVADLAERVRETVSEAVRLRLMSDVPLGAHLSGGIDSSIVVGLMASMMEQPVATFSVGFQEDAFSELDHARLVAREFQTEHHEFVLEPDILDVLPKLVAHFDEPFADPAAIPTWYLAQMTRPHATVALNGDGGDEGFAGYQRYYADVAADAYRMVPAWARHNVFDRLLSALPVQPGQPRERSYAMALRQLPRAANLTHAASMVRWGTYFDEADKWALYSGDMRQAVAGKDSTALLQEAFEQALANHRLDRTLYTDVRNYLPSVLLPKVDRMTMAHSVEARSPFLDHKVMELAARIPVHWKVRGRQTKRILRRAFADLLPAAIARRPKMGFGVPLGLWFRGALYQPARDLLLAPSTRLYHYLSREGVRRLLAEHQDGQADHGKRIWTLLNLELWLRQCGQEHRSLAG